MTKNESEGERPFQGVFVDIAKASENKVCCVEKALDEVEYVALSYRWGEVHEQSVDTGVGYMATIKSFHLDDFFLVCRLMRHEVDLCKIQYVWVDSICVDQTNAKRRKATVYQMSNIYESAAYILAVPDLHASYLRNVSAMNWKAMQNSHCYRMDLYYLIHGDTTTLEEIENEQLDSYGVPKDVQKELIRRTDHCMPAMMKPKMLEQGYNDDIIMQQIYEKSQASKKDVVGDEEKKERCAHGDCQFELIRGDVVRWESDKLARHCNLTWPQLVRRRSTAIRCSMRWMMDLMRDWSTRVWVISEYSIAKKQNKLKYWFLQLQPHLVFFDHDFPDNYLTFFRFNFNDTSFNDVPNSLLDRQHPLAKQVYGDPVHLTFHKTMRNQLTQETFLEMMLKSKASKHVDRFYAILPLTDYSNKLRNVVDDQIQTLIDVKLELFKLMTAKDKLDLLYLSKNDFVMDVFRNTTEKNKLLPTFATSNINWDDPHLWQQTDCSNFDLTTNASLCQDHRLDLPYLHLTAKEYFVDEDNFDHASFNETNKGLWDRLGGPFDRHVVVYIHRTPVDINFDRNGHVLYLVGNFECNIWVFLTQNDYHAHSSRDKDLLVIHHDGSDHSDGFQIY